MIKAVEFFSGIGAFAAAARQFSASAAAADQGALQTVQTAQAVQAAQTVDVVAAFDQSEAANRVYKLNFGHQPRARNLDSIPANEIPQADMWWLSPPCTPYSVRGKQKDADDPRARSFLHLISLIGAHRPTYLAVENVLGFKDSKVHSILYAELARQGYTVHAFDLCSTQLGTPMRRPRHFVLASRAPMPPPLPVPPPVPRDNGSLPLRSYLIDGSCERPELRPSDETVQRYGESYDIVDPLDDGAVAICFTSGYGKSQKVSGSLIKIPHSNNQLRRFSPHEILHLLGFPAGYHLPEDLPLESAWRLVGNSVDVRCVQFCLQHLIDQTGTKTERAAPSAPLS